MKKGKFERKFYRKKTIEKYEAECLLLGPTVNASVFSFLNVRLLSAICLFIILFILDYRNFISSFVISGVYFYIFPKLYFDYRIEKRKRKLEKEAVSFFEVLTLSLESGRNLMDSLKITTDNMDFELSLEFKQVLEEVKYGKGLEEALRSLKNRIPSSTVQNMILNLSQSNTYGNNVVKNLHQQIEFIREIRVMSIKEKINKMPIQVSVVSVLLFVPLILLLVLSPVLIEFLFV